MLDDTYIIQTAQGSSGAALPVTSFTPTFATPTTAGNAVITVFAHPDSNRSVLGPTTAWLNLVTLNTIAPAPHIEIMGVQTPGGETTFACTINGVGDVVCWLMIEVTGLATMDSVLDTFGSPTNQPVANDGAAGSTGARFAAGTTLGTGNSSTPNTNGDDLVLSAGCSVATAGGTPALLSGIADTTAGQPGTWAQLGTTVATSRVANNNVRLDVYRKYTGGHLHLLDATYTWAASTPGAGALIGAASADIVPPQGTPGRAATNSMM